MPTVGTSGKVGGMQGTPGGGGGMEIVGPTPGTLPSQHGSEGEDPLLGTSM